MQPVDCTQWGWPEVETIRWFLNVFNSYNAHHLELKYYVSKMWGHLWFVGSWLPWSFFIFSVYCFFLFKNEAINQKCPQIFDTYYFRYRWCEWAAIRWDPFPMGYKTLLPCQINLLIFLTLEEEGMLALCICKVQFKKIYIYLDYKVLTIENGNFVW